MNDAIRIPEVDLCDASGRPATTRGLGRAVLFVFPKADTPGCTNEARDFSALSGEFARQGVRLIGLSKDAPAKLARFAAKYGLTVELWSDADSDLTDRLGVWVEKAMYGKTYMGLERSTFLIGADGTVERSWRKVKVAGHAAAVLAAVAGQ